MKRILFFLLFINQTIFAQSYTISGFVEDAKSGEKLINVNIFSTISGYGSISNNYGFYSITLTKGQEILQYSYIGYKTIQKKFELRNDTIINIKFESNINLPEINVFSRTDNIKVINTKPGIFQIPVQSIKLLPVLFGEVDILKTLQLLPGIQSGNEGTSGLYVRGGSPDQNLMLLDDVPIYNVNHLFGLFSIFNADAIKSVKLIKGGFPSQYGGRISSVLDIRLKDGNCKKYHGSVTIGTISSKFLFEGPIIKDKTSFVLSFRRSYYDLFLRPIQKYSHKDYSTYQDGYYFYDVVAKISHKISQKNRLFFTLYKGEDFAYRYKEKEEPFPYNDNSNLKWGNTTSAVRWNCVWNDKLFSNTTLTYSNYHFSTMTDFFQNDSVIYDNINIEYLSGIKDASAKIDFDYYPNINNKIKFGVGLKNPTYLPGNSKYLSFIDSNTVAIDTVYKNKTFKPFVFSAYINDDIKFGKQFTSNIGVRTSIYEIDSSVYHSFEPRFSFQYLLNKSIVFKGTFSYMQQYLHLLTNSTASLPTDLWVPATKNVPPESATQLSIGVNYSLNKIYEFSFVGFNKFMKNVIAYKEGSGFSSFENEWQDKIESGKAQSYGIELLVQKLYGKTTGWLGYTLSKSDRQFDNINEGKIFPYKYDRRHDISIVVKHNINKKFTLGLTWVYGTGNAVTLQTEKYVIPNYQITNGNTSNYNDPFFIKYFSHRNNYRMADYHRLDISLNYHKKKKNADITWQFGIYNVYNRKNPYYLYFQRYSGKENLTQVSLVPFMPFISYNYKF